MLWKYEFLLASIGEHEKFILTVLNNYLFYIIRCMDKFFKSVLFGFEIKQAPCFRVVPLREGLCRSLRLRLSLKPQLSN